MRQGKMIFSGDVTFLHNSFYRILQYDSEDFSTCWIHFSKNTNTGKTPVLRLINQFASANANNDVSFIDSSSLNKSMGNNH